MNRSGAPLHSPHKTSPEIEQQVLALRRQLPTFGAARLKREFDLPVSHHGHPAHLAPGRFAERTSQKISTQTGPGAHQSAMGSVPANQSDTKDLDDIPHCWPQAQQFDLPFSTPRAKCAAGCCSSSSGSLPALYVPLGPRKWGREYREPLGIRSRTLFLQTAPFWRAYNSDFKCFL